MSQKVRKIQNFHYPLDLNWGKFEMLTNLRLPHSLWPLQKQYLNHI